MREPSPGIDPANGGPDPQALTRLLSEHSETLRAAIEPKIPDRLRSVLSAEDVLQQTFLDAFLDMRNFIPSDESSFFRWLRKLAENNLIEAIRALDAEKRGGRARRVATLGVDPCTSILDRLVPVLTRTSPPHAAALREASLAVREAIARLPEAYRAAVELYDIEGRDIADVAATLSRSPGAVHLLRNRAFARLREQLTAFVTNLSQRSVNPGG